MKVYLGNTKINRVYSGNKELVTQEQSDLVNLDYVVVAGGGSGGSGGAGGGAGGALTGSIQLLRHPLISKTFTATIGQGAASASITPLTYSGSRGENSYFGNPNLFEFTAIGGGGGGSFGSGSNYTNGAKSGSFGGSGGGGAANTGSRGLGTANQGNDGGWGGGGGGGATALGGNASLSGMGNGGAGHYIWWNKYNSGRVADGGGCGSNNQFGAGINAGSAGGVSGGQGGGLGGLGGGEYAPPNGGGGGGGGRSSGTAPYNDSGGGFGGSGIVLLRYEGQARAFGGEIYTTGSYTVHAFTSSGIFTI